MVVVVVMIHISTYLLGIRDVASPWWRSLTLAENTNSDTLANSHFILNVTMSATNEQLNPSTVAVLRNSSALLRQEETG